MSEYLVLGAYPFFYVSYSVEGSNCEFEYKKVISQGYKVCLTKDNEDYTLSLKVQQGECGSGWCVAIWGLSSLIKSDTKQKITLYPKQGLEVITFNEGDEDIKNDLFSVIYDGGGSYDGGDSYYPSGGAFLHRANWEICKPKKSDMK